MNVVYVNKKSEASMLKNAFEAAGFRCLRMKTFCDCQDQGNNRHGVIILDGDKVVLEVRGAKGVRNFIIRNYMWEGKPTGRRAIHPTTNQHRI